MTDDPFFTGDPVPCDPCEKAFHMNLVPRHAVCMGALIGQHEWGDELERQEIDRL